MAILFKQIEPGDVFAWDGEALLYTAKFYVKDPVEDPKATTGTGTPVKFVPKGNGTLAYVPTGGRPVSFLLDKSILPLIEH